MLCFDLLCFALLCFALLCFAVLCFTLRYFHYLLIYTELSCGISCSQAVLTLSISWAVCVKMPCVCIFNLNSPLVNQVRVKTTERASRNTKTTTFTITVCRIHLGDTVKEVRSSSSLIPTRNPKLSDLTFSPLLQGLSRYWSLHLFVNEMIHL